LEEVDRQEFGTSSAIVNAFYSSIKNGITFPAAILQAPFFDRTFPKALNYAAMGSVIGHEITHGFDDSGSQFDARGNLFNWWDTETEKRFKNLTKCIIDQYGSYEVEGTGLKINGILTQGENIADNGGIRQSYKAYRAYIDKQGYEEKRLPGYEGYSSNQIFFIAYVSI
jgi:predicted metalloendopeptidase